MWGRQPAAGRGGCPGQEHCLLFWLPHTQNPALTPPSPYPTVLLCLEMVSTQLENPVRKLIGGEQFLSVPHLSREKETHMVLIYDIVFFLQVY